MTKLSCSKCSLYHEEKELIINYCGQCLPQVCIHCNIYCIKISFCPESECRVNVTLPTKILCCYCKTNLTRAALQKTQTESITFQLRIFLCRDNYRLEGWMLWRTGSMLTCVCLWMEANALRQSESSSSEVFLFDSTGETTQMQTW